MAWSSGFFNSLNGDRKYGTDDISGIFTGVIHDGVFQTVGERFEVKANGGMGITIGTGRSWTFDCWSYNTSTLPIVLEKGDVLHPRWDVIVHEVNKTDAGRFAKPVYKQGTPSANPQVPELTNTELIEQRYLAKIYVAQNATSITQAQIENRVGTSDFPFVTGIVSSMNIDSLISQWESQWSAWYNDTDAGFDKWYNTQTDEFEDYFVDKKKAFDDWFKEMKTILNEDVAGNLQQQVNDANEEIDAIKNPAFTEYSTFVNIASGDSVFTLFGKIKKWISVIGTATLTTSAKTIREAINELTTRVDTIGSEVDDKAVKSHASKTTDFGVGTSASYGHLKITNTLSSTATDAALSAAAGKNLNDTVNGKAPNSHASTASTYGLGTTGNYGHVKTINWLSQSVHEDGLALSAYQGFVLNNKLGTQVTYSLSGTTLTITTK